MYPIVITSQIPKYVSRGLDSVPQYYDEYIEDHDLRIVDELPIPSRSYSKIIYVQKTENHSIKYCFDRHAFYGIEGIAEGTLALDKETFFPTNTESDSYLDFKGTVLDALADQNIIPSKWRTLSGNTTQHIVIDPRGTSVIDTGKSEFKSTANNYPEDLKFILMDAFRSVIPNFEKIFNKDLAQAEHEVVIALVIYQVGSGSTASPWHTDGLEEAIYPASSLLYFRHNCAAKLSFKNDSDLRDDGLFTIDTTNNLSVTFANARLKHKVHNLEHNGGNGQRGLCTFFYKGPHRIPYTLDPISPDNSSYDKDENKLNGEVAYYFKKSHKLLT
jgi:hypothetical protein